MKSLSLVLLIVILPLLAVSQQNYPLIKDGGVWREARAAVNTPPDPWWIHKHQYLMEGDTVFNNINYKKIYSCDYSPAINNKSFFGGIRQDSLNKVFIYLDTGSVIESAFSLQPLTEYLLYDFSLNVGDTFNVVNSRDSILVLSSVDSVLINNNYRKRWHFGGDRTWLEGIGSVGGLFFPLQYCFEEDQMLTCYEDSIINWLNPELAQNGIDCFSVGIKPIDTQVELSKAYPNPCLDFITIDFNQNIARNTSVEIYNLLGQFIKSFALPANFKKANIDVSSLKRGVYIYKVLTVDGIINTGKFIKE